jgi:hypothetical protein
MLLFNLFLKIYIIITKTEANYFLKCVNFETLMWKFQGIKLTDIIVCIHYEIFQHVFLYL